MLVLARRTNESLMLGDDIEIKILSVDGDTVRIGIEAPRSLVVLRKELYTEVAQENRTAVEVTSEDIDKLSGLL
jgi:carbon storage regulator